MTTGPIPPVDAASVILVRDNPVADGEWEVFMVRRHVRSEFAADVYVFPGGKLDEADRDIALASILDVQLPQDAPDSPAFRIAAIRELFEEAGVLLAVGPGDMHSGEVEVESFRQALHSGEISLREIVQRSKLKLAVSKLHPFARWITPESMPRRFDTWFYLARVPRGHTPRHDEVETVHSLWIQPGEALRRAASGEFPLVFVTEQHLERMARYGSIDELWDSVTERDLQPVMPRVLERAGHTTFLLPGEAGY